jgi:hypothetical protein
MFDLNRYTFQQAMITTQRIILYRTDDDPYEILHSYDFTSSMTIRPIG